jgi:hypothetical protein
MKLLFCMPALLLLLLLLPLDIFLVFQMLLLLCQ